MTIFHIECGDHRGHIEASTIGEAWRKLTDGETKGFAELARYREIKPRQTPWLYIEPAALDLIP